MTADHDHTIPLLQTPRLQRRSQPSRLPAQLRPGNMSDGGVALSHLSQRNFGVVLVARGPGASRW